MKLWFIIILGIFLVSCNRLDEIKSSIDRLSFETTGGTVFSNPTTVTTKEIHFDTGKLVGVPVILTGRVEELGSHHTHITLSDSSGRLLVVMTELSESDQYFKDTSKPNIKVFGVIERGKKGLPFLQASAIKLIEEGQ